MKRSSLLFIVLLVLSLFVAPAAEGDSPEPHGVVDFTRVSPDAGKKIEFSFGTNEFYDHLYGYGIDKTRLVGAKVVRLWLGEHFMDTVGEEYGSYDWDRLYAFIDHVLWSGATPLVNFQGPPRWIRGADGGFSPQREHAELTPEGRNQFANYVAHTIKQLQSVYGDQIFNWYWEVWNEPNNHGNAGAHYACHPQNYVNIFNTVDEALDRTFGKDKIKLGGPSLDAIDGGVTYDENGVARCTSGTDYDWYHYLKYVLDRTDPDFVSWHWYAIFEVNDAPWVEEVAFGTRLSWFEDRVRAVTAMIQGRGKRVLNITEEFNYNSDTAVDPKNWQQVGAAFISAGILKVVRHGGNALLVFKGSNKEQDRGLGLWTNDPLEDEASYSRAYYAIKLLNEFLQNGSTICYSKANDPYLELLAFKNERGYFVAVVNKDDQWRTFNIASLGSGPCYFTDERTKRGQAYCEGSIPLDRYGVGIIHIEAGSVQEQTSATPTPVPTPTLTPQQVNDATRRHLISNYRELFSQTYDRLLYSLIQRPY